MTDAKANEHNRLWRFRMLFKLLCVFGLRLVLIYKERTQILRNLLYDFFIFI